MATAQSFGKRIARYTVSISLPQWSILHSSHTMWCLLSHSPNAIWHTV